MAKWIHTKMIDGRPLSLNMDNAEDFYPVKGSDHVNIVMMSWSGSNQPRSFEIRMTYNQVVAALAD